MVAKDLSLSFVVVFSFTAHVPPPTPPPSPPCSNTSWYGIGQLYAGPANSSSLNSTDGIVNMYYLNNFDNILRSYGIHAPVTIEA